MAEDEEISLGPQEAVDLWKQGREVWNAWVAENPVADISFAGVGFNQYRGLDTIPQDEWPFESFCFPTGEKNFDFATFGNGYVSFFGATFGNGDVSFSDTTFGEGDVSFHHATFGQGQVVFRGINFGNGNFIFDAADLGQCSYNFEDTVFKDRASFANLRKVHAAKSFSFRHASFGGAFTLSGNETFGCVPDLVGTKASHHISLAGLKRQFPTELNSSGYRRARDSGDAERLRRLKELAEQNRDFEAAIDFKVEEMRAARWRNKHGFTSVFVEGLFYLVSDYGRSLVRPIVGLGSVWVGFAMLYVIAGKRAFDCQAVGAGLSFSWGQMFIYVPTSKNAREEGMQALFSSPHSDWLFVATFSQSLLSLVLLFQVGLVLRNRFKL